MLVLVALSFHTLSFSRVETQLRPNIAFESYVAGPLRWKLSLHAAKAGGIRAGHGVRG